MAKTSNYHQITERIVASKKYRRLYPKTIARIVQTTFEKYEANQVEKEARKKLHQIWGAYWKSYPNFNKLLEKFKRDLKQGRGVQESLLPILNLQSSTRERIAILDRFYQKIFKLTGFPNTIIDHACGLNPLTYPWMNLPKATRYYAFDIDSELAHFLKQMVKLMGYEKQIKVGLGDLLANQFDEADLALMLKTIPLLEQQQKGSTLTVLPKLRCKYLVVSFPIYSLSGRPRGMIDFYSQYFQNILQHKSWPMEKILFETELIFVIKKSA